MHSSENQDEKGPRRVDITSPEDEEPEAPAAEEPEEQPADEAAEDQPPEEPPAEPEPDPQTAELEAKVEELGLQMAEAVTERQRAAADLHNFRQRARKDREQAIRLANESLLSDLIPVLDTFELALNVQTDSAASESILEGVQMIRIQLIGALRGHGVEQMVVEGQKFDPALHEALEREESEEHPPDTIIGEIQKGYTLNGQVVRAAKVRVAAKPAEGTEEG